MSRRWRYLKGALFGLVVTGAVGVVVLLVARTTEPPPPPLPPRFPRSEPPPHPVIPSSEVERPPQPFCEVRDIHAVGARIRRAHRASLVLAKGGPRSGAPSTCHGQPDNQSILAAQNELAGRTAACVARDAPLDSQWAELESAVLALGQCVDCTVPRDKRLRACGRVLELTDSAQSTAKP